MTTESNPLQQEQNRPQKHSKNRTGNRPQGTEQLTPQQRKQQWIDGKLERAKNDDFNVIQQKTRDTAETVNFLNIVDNLMYHIRMSSGTRGSRIPEGATDKYIKRINSIKDELNLVAAEMCRDTNRTYRPPRGYKNPLLDNKQKTKEPDLQTKTSVKAVKKADNKAPADGQKVAQTMPHLIPTATVPKDATTIAVPSAA